MKSNKMTLVIILFLGVMANLEGSRPAEDSKPAEGSHPEFMESAPKRAGVVRRYSSKTLTKGERLALLAVSKTDEYKRIGVELEAQQSAFFSGLTEKHPELSEDELKELQNVVDEAMNTPTQSSAAKSASEKK